MDNERLILITGALGYVGSVLTPAVAKLYPVRAYDSMMFGNHLEGTPNVEFVKGDIRDGDLLRRALDGVTDVIHLAGVVTDELVDMNVSLAKEINVEAMKALCRLCSEASVQRFIYASSSSVYGSQDSVCTEETRPEPMTPYAFQKLEGEKLLRGWSFLAVSIRLATLCGPAPRMRLDTIVNIFSKQAYFDKEITVWDGSQWRSNLNVRDAARIFLKLLWVCPSLIAGETFNATTGNNTARELAEKVASVVHSAGVFVDSSKHDLRHYRMDASKAERVLGWAPQHSIREAVLDNIEFFRSGGIEDPEDDIYVNTRRMASFMKGKA